MKTETAAKPEAKTETKPENLALHTPGNPEAHSSLAATAKTETKPEHKPEVKTDVKPEAKTTQGTKPEPRKRVRRTRAQLLAAGIKAGAVKVRPAKVPSTVKELQFAMRLLLTYSKEGRIPPQAVHDQGLAALAASEILA